LKTSGALFSFLLKNSFPPVVLLRYFALNGSIFYKRLPNPNSFCESFRYSYNRSRTNWDGLHPLEHPSHPKVYFPPCAAPQFILATFKCGGGFFFRALVRQRPHLSQSHVRLSPDPRGWVGERAFFFFGCVFFFFFFFCFFLFGNQNKKPIFEDTVAAFAPDSSPFLESSPKLTSSFSLCRDALRSFFPNSSFYRIRKRSGVILIFVITPPTLVRSRPSDLVATAPLGRPPINRGGTSKLGPFF